MNLFKAMFAKTETLEPPKRAKPKPQRTKTPISNRRVRIQLKENVFSEMNEVCPSGTYMSVFANDLILEALAARRKRGAMSLRTK